MFLLPAQAGSEFLLVLALLALVFNILIGS